MELGRTLEPLAPHRKKLNVITGLFNKPAVGVGIHPGQTGNILSGMPLFLKTLGWVGMLAMLWVGGGIIIHGLHELGVSAPEEMIQHVAAGVGGVFTWLVQASLSGLVGLIIGGIANLLMKPFSK